MLVYEHMINTVKSRVVTHVQREKRPGAAQAKVHDSLVRSLP